MKVLGSNISNVLNEYKSMIKINKRDMPAASKAAADLISTDNTTVKPEITKNSDT